MTRTHGRHELGQNFLVDHSVIDSILAIVAQWPDAPLLELGAGDGALTAALVALRRPMTVVELDPRRAERLASRFGDRVDVRHADMLATDLGTGADLVSNVPYGVTTPLLRRALRAPAWRHGLFLVQWEVARKRAAVGGTTLLTAQWWPWFELGLEGRVPAGSFRPRPSVDGGLLHVVRRENPLVPESERVAYQRLVAAVFAGRGRGVVDVAGRITGRTVAHRWMVSQGLRASTLPRDVDAAGWAALHLQRRREVRADGGGRRPRRR